MYKVYLSSTTYHWWNLFSYTWKKKLIKEIKIFNKKIKFIDPLSFKSEDPIVCPKDIKDIDQCKFVAIYIDKLSIGTLLELGYCIYTKKKNWCIITNNSYVYNHPWIKYFCNQYNKKICRNVKEAAKIILKDYKNTYGIYKHKRN